ncbi:MAG: hypothetical protein PVI04_05405 [Anaerolineales bacterium]|jgi:hypothetical protein
MQKNSGWLLIRNVVLKASFLFVLFNLAYALVYPREMVGSISGYNRIFPGRKRFPHGDVPEKAFNITTSNLRAMFESHVVSQKSDVEFRIVIIGDSSVWGFLLEPDQTFSAKLNQQGMKAPGGESVRFYNLGYPTLSVTKDLLLLDRSLGYDPDMIIWLVTLESLINSAQLDSPLLTLNPTPVNDLLDKYGLVMPGNSKSLEPPTILERTIVGNRVELAELIRLQLFGFAWAATGVDHYIPENYNERMEDLSSEVEYKGLQRGELGVEDLYIDALDAGARYTDEIPVLMINEPIFISSGANSDVRYNFFYPRWVYDRYRSLLGQHAEQNGWQFLDLWDLIPADEFTDSAIHYSPDGNAMMADRIGLFLKTEYGFTISGQ